MGNKRQPFTPDTFYHVYNHGNGSDNIFRIQENYRYFLQKYAEYISSIADTFAYCLMPNHFHFLLRIKSQDELIAFFNSINPQCFKKDVDLRLVLEDLLSNQFKNFLISYAKAFNKMFERKGSLFLDNIHRKQVMNYAYFKKLVLYIHYNSVHHRFSETPDEWPHSSWHAMQSEEKTRLQREHVFKWFGGKKDFVQAHHCKLDPSFFIELDNIFL